MKKGISQIVIIVIVAVLAVTGATGGTYYLMKTKANKEKQTLETDKTNLQNQIDELQKQIKELQKGMAGSTEKKDETAGWKTFTNSTLSFSLKYPSNWTKKGLYLYSSEKFGPGPEAINYYVWIKEYKNPQDLSFKDVVAQAEFPNDATLKNSFKFTKETISGYTVYKTENIPSRSGQLSAFFTEDESRYISLSLVPYDKANPFEGQSKYLNIFNLILSTFKFTK